MRKLNLRAALTLIAILAAVLTTSTLYYLSTRTDELPQRAVRICAPAFATSMPIAVAQQFKFFDANGIKADIEFRELGKTCIDDLLVGKVDYAVAYTTPVVRKIHQGRQLKIYTLIHESNRNTSLVYRKKKNFKLEGSKIGLVPGTNADFFYELILRSSGVNRKRVKVLKAEQTKIAKLIETKKVDAIIAWEPILSKLLAKGDYEVYPTPHYTELSFLVGMKNKEKEFEETTPGVLRALASSIQVLKENPEKVRDTIVKGVPELADAVSSSSTNHHDPLFGFTAVMFSMLEEEYSFVAKARVDDPRTPQVIFDALALGPIREIAPEMVNVR